MLSIKGLGDGEINNILANLHREYNRRVNIGKESLVRRQKIKEMYKRLHPTLYTLQVLLQCGVIDISAFIIVTIVTLYVSY